MLISKYESKFQPVKVFLTRFFDFESDILIFEQETQIPIPTISMGDIIEIFEDDYVVKERKFAFNEDAFFTIYRIELLGF
ncbi:hypothetical protein [Paenibacillus sp. P46E]|uniref:hypothetical protein n=1 Tax=Paenibacillus sp. P46E TaxID=1349436 RepID=UPI00093E7A0C|nr:hypothetical protein [Paenibacillus sp. P46E]OKP95299.1 hypothetical protein A3849_27365 [Paenibacillus sp. P46E]